MKKSYIAVALAAACIAAIGFFAFGKGGIGGGKAQKVVIQNIRRMYDKNKVQVNADYLGKKIQITNEFARVQFVRKGDRLSFNSTGAYNVAEKDGYIVDLKYTYYGVDEFLGENREELVRCYFDKSEEQALTQLVNGVDVTVVGVFDGEESPYLSIPFRLKNCKIDSVERHLTIKDSIATLTDEVNKGNVRAMHCLGCKYLLSNSAEQNLKEGMKWLEKAAKEGYSDSQYIAGLAYANRIRCAKGVPKDTAKAHEYYRMAADQGNAGAMTEIGRMYENGDGVPKDLAKARGWYRKAAVAGSEPAEIDLKRIEGK